MLSNIFGCRLFILSYPAYETTWLNSTKKGNWRFLDSHRKWTKKKATLFLGGVNSLIFANAARQSSHPKVCSWTLRLVSVGVGKDGKVSWKLSWKPNWSDAEKVCGWKKYEETTKCVWLIIIVICLLLCFDRQFQPQNDLMRRSVPRGFTHTFFSPVPFKVLQDRRGLTVAGEWADPALEAWDQDDRRYGFSVAISSMVWQISLFWSFGNPTIWDDGRKAGIHGDFGSSTLL